MVLDLGDSVITTEAQGSVQAQGHLPTIPDSAGTGQA